MKLKILLTIITLLFLPTHSMIRTCKTQILRSFTFSSRITPNLHNSLCPRVSLNCCTNHDQMKMHKMWTEVSKPNLTKYYEKFYETFKKLKQVISLKEEIDLIAFNYDFKKFSKYKPSKKLFEHLKKLASKFSIFDSSYLMDSLEELILKHIPFVQKNVLKMRSGVLCAYCDYDYQAFINIESLTITYHQDFCFKLADDFLEIMSQKYQIFEVFLFMDEWMYLTVERRLIPSPTDRAVLRRYIQIISRCQKLKGNLQECADFCREFNINKYTYMFDGEKRIVEEIIENFLDFYKDSAHPKSLYGKNHKISTHMFKFFKKNHSLSSKKQISDPLAKRLEKNDFGLHFIPQGIKTFIEKTHPTNEIQIMTLDEEISSYTLYKRNDNPIDISRYQILFEQFQGINLYDSSKLTNLNLSSDKLLALLHIKGKDEKELNEIMERNVKRVVKEIKIDTIADWVHDNKLDFVKIGGDRNYRTEIVKNYESRLFSIFGSIFG